VIAVAINGQNLTHEFIAQSKVFTGSILSQDTPLNFIGNFGFKSGRQFDKFKGVQYKLDETSVPIVLDHHYHIIVQALHKNLNHPSL
jgi:ferric-chelate reductase [NAD(P)H]